MNLVFVSTGLNAPTKRLCLASVAKQTVKCEHIYVESDPAVTVTQNWYEAIAKLPASTIVALLDGDDWLAHEQVAAQVLSMHGDGMLVTYGSYVDSDGKPGVCAPYERADYRHEPWRASHLKTFRAGLFHKLAPEDLQIDGKWLDVAADIAVMIPLLEMSGPDRVAFCTDTLVIYHRPSSFEANTDVAGRAREKQVEGVIRARPGKARC